MATNIGYDFTEVLSRIEKTPDVVKYLIDSGKELETISEEDRLDYGIRYALESASATHDTVFRILNVPNGSDNYFEKINARVRIVNDFLSSASALDVRRVSGPIAQAFRSSAAFVADAAKNSEPGYGRIADLMYEILLSLNLESLGAEYAFYGEALGSLSSNTEKANAAAAKMREGETIAAVSSGHYHRGLYYFTGTQAPLYITDVDFLNWLEDYAINGESNWGNSGGNYSKVFALAPVDDGDYAINYFKKRSKEANHSDWAHPSRFFLAAYGTVPSDCPNIPMYTRILNAIIDDPEMPDVERRRALLALARMNPVEINNRVPLWVEFLTSNPAMAARNPGSIVTSIYDVRCDNFVDVSTKLDLAIYPIVYSAVGSIAGGTIPISEQARLRSEIVQSIAERVAADVSGNISPDTLAALWDVTVMERGQSRPATAVSLAQQALVNTRRLPEVKLNEATKQKGKVGILAKQVLSGLKIVQEVKIKSGGMLDFPIVTGVAFKDYLNYGVNSGLSPVAVLGLYAVDARLDNPSRVQARVDFINLLNTAPEMAEEIPDEVWAGLLRVRDPLPIGATLAQEMQNLGENAAKLGSKNLVKSVFL